MVDEAVCGSVCNNVKREGADDSECEEGSEWKIQKKTVMRRWNTVIKVCWLFVVDVLVSIF